MECQMKIIVTGSEGQLALEIKNKSVEYKEWEFIFRSREQLDISNESQVRECIATHRPDYVINTAAYTNVEKAESEKERCFLVNTRAVSFLYDALNVYGGRLIHISSDYVFDGKKNSAYTETDMCNPLNVYGLSKREAELIVLQNPDHLVVRTSWLYSPYGHNFFKTIWNLSSKKKELSIVSDQIGAPVYCGDLAHFLLWTLARPSSAGLIHFSPVSSCSWYEFGLAITAHSHPSCRVHPVPSSAYPQKVLRPSFSYLSPSKLIDDWGYPPVCWTESLLDCVKKFKALSGINES